MMWHKSLLVIIRSTCRRVGIIPLAALTGVIAVAAVLSFRIPTAPKIEASETQIAVNAVELSLVDQPIIISGYGTVQPMHLLEIRPQVSGVAIAVGDFLEEGGRIPRGATIVQIDPRDYEIEVESKSADVTHARSALKLEQGNQIIARHEWGLLENSVGLKRKDQDLALRRPHLEQRQAELHAALSQLRRAELNLERTYLSAPFEALVLETSIEQGSYISAGSTIAKLAAVDQFEVVVKVPSDVLAWLDYRTMSVANPEGAPSRRVKVYRPSMPAESLAWQGQVQRVLGTVDASGRMAQIAVAIENPLYVEDNRAPLLVGTYVRVDIHGRTLTDVYRLPRSAFRDGNMVYVANHGNRLKLRKVNPVYSTEEEIYVREGFRKGDRIVLTPLHAALEGASVRIEGTS